MSLGDHYSFCSVAFSLIMRRWNTRFMLINGKFRRETKAHAWTTRRGRHGYCGAIAETGCSLLPLASSCYAQLVTQWRISILTLSSAPWPMNPGDVTTLLRQSRPGNIIPGEIWSASINNSDMYVGIYLSGYISTNQQSKETCVATS